MWATPRAGQSAGSHDVEWEPGKKPILNGKPISTSLTDQIRLSPSSGVSDPSDAVNRVHRLKALGNGIVPAVAYIFAAAIADVLQAERGAQMERAA